ncbi:hypothetical protein BGW80DRAFT_1286991 [Lactifluus volemus]|nr:hypothetical protein BGW80DRAFT_1286991 [Lactifluus volemus]
MVNGASLFFFLTSHTDISFFPSLPLSSASPPRPPPCGHARPNTGDVLLPAAAVPAPASATAAAAGTNARLRSSSLVTTIIISMTVVKSKMGNIIDIIRSFRSAAKAAVPQAVHAVFSGRDRDRLRGRSMTSLQSDFSLGSGRSSMSSDTWEVSI